jgi:hypothetical protein
MIKRSLCSFALLTGVLVGCSVDASEEDVASSEEALSSYDPGRGNRIANRASALWNGRGSRGLCLAGVNDTLETCGAVSPAFPRLPSAVAFDDWAKRSPGELARRGFEKQNIDINRIPRGSIIAWRPGQCGYHSQYGHIEIVVDDGSSRACSDYCGSIKKSCGAPAIYVPVTGGSNGGVGSGACGVKSDGKLHCESSPGAAIRSEPKNGSGVVNRLRTERSWFDCWTKGEVHAGGNDTWYHTLGDDNGNWGFVAAVDLSTTSAFDASPSGLRKCGP